MVLEDNRLQTLALSVAERGGAGALPAQVRVIEIMEAAGRIDRIVEGLESNEDLLRRAQDERGLTRPELAILLSRSEEHTSELQSLMRISYAVFCLKKKKKTL